MNIFSTKIPGLMVVETSRHKDMRGAFSRFYCENELAPLIDHRQILQINHSLTNNLGAVRGLHFQYPPHAEMKLVRCVKGKVWDVVVDLRKGSPTFLSWHAEELTASNMRLMVIPEGFAHGFQVLEAGSELLYLHTALYAPDAQGGLNYGDTHLNIIWPLSVTDVSYRDSNHAMIDEGFKGMSL